ncbi:hypothetical protein NPIL_607941 [Nephila pilipes]|uniref:Uncharacterized protein n=1 Tax=Nephila pilipes TaxID=299642 RepID=A0A8X6U4A7_NEPPI|nr:hypothetical protein NPIL_607941 [Nephila pilipes]
MNFLIATQVQNYYSKKNAYLVANCYMSLSKEWQTKVFLVLRHFLLTEKIYNEYDLLQRGQIVQKYDSQFHTNIDASRYKTYRCAASTRIPITVTVFLFIQAPGLPNLYLATCGTFPIFHNNWTVFAISDCGFLLTFDFLVENL